MGKIEPMNIEQRPPKNKPATETKDKPAAPKIVPVEQEILAPDFVLLKVDGPPAYFASEIDMKNVGVSSNYVRLMYSIIYTQFCFVS